MSAKVRIRLTEEQRRSLLQFTRTGPRSPQSLVRARILLLADAAGPHALTDERIVEQWATAAVTVMRVRPQLVVEGLDATRHRKKPTGRVYRELDGTQEAQLIALTCSQAPDGQARWTMKLLADKLVELEVVESIDPATVWRTLKETTSSRGSSARGSFRRKRTRRS